MMTAYANVDRTIVQSRQDCIEHKKLSKWADHIQIKACFAQHGSNGCRVS